jgi:ADP-heptose:LPS heptosyltransferase
MLGGIKRRWGFDYRGRGMFLNRKVEAKNFDDAPMREYYLRLAKAWNPQISLSAHYPDPQFREAAVKEFKSWETAQGMGGGELWLAVAPGGGASWGDSAKYKQWPIEHFAASVQAICQKQGLRPLYIGSSDEKSMIERLDQAARVRGSFQLIGAPLARVAQMIQTSKLFLGNDGGMLHLANWVGTPSLGIYGPVSDLVYGALKQDRSAVNLTADVPCRPCYRNFNFPPCPYNARCLSELKPESVIHAAGQLDKADRLR